MIELLTNDQMRQADAAAIAGGVSAIELMEAAGKAVTEAVVGICSAPGPVLVLCGPGNNGGDGFIVGRRLQEQGYEVRLALIGERAALPPTAAEAAKRWKGETRSFDSSLMLGCCLIVDAIYGAGLSRDLDGEARRVVEVVNSAEKPVLAVDIPSGVDGDSGTVRGVAIKADVTVTFFRYRPGHVLLPGRALCGKRHLAQIGIPETVLEKLRLRSFLNRPELWESAFPRPELASHKYTRGHALIAGGSEMTGAARLAARGALRAGAGVVTVVAARSAMPIYQTALEAVIVRPMDHAQDYALLLEDERRNALLIGPGAGVGTETRALVRMALGSRRPVVLDADAFTSFEAKPQALREAVTAAEGPVVFTPHAGEFKRVFSDIAESTESKLEQARKAAEILGTVVLIKGADSVVAAPDGRAAIADNGPPWLATAGSGDVLAGIITGLLAQKMPAFEATCAAVWLHGEAGAEIGPGLIAEDIPDALRPVLRRLFSRPSW